MLIVLSFPPLLSQSLFLAREEEKTETILISRRRSGCAGHPCPLTHASRPQETPDTHPRADNIGRPL